MVSGFLHSIVSGILLKISCLMDIGSTMALDSRISNDCPREEMVNAIGDQSVFSEGSMSSRCLFSRDHYADVLAVSDRSMSSRCHISRDHYADVLAVCGLLLSQNKILLHHYTRKWPVDDEVLLNSKWSHLFGTRFCTMAGSNPWTNGTVRPYAPPQQQFHQQMVPQYAAPQSQAMPFQGSQYNTGFPSLPPRGPPPLRITARDVNGLGVTNFATPLHEDVNAEVVAFALNTVSDACERVRRERLTPGLLRAHDSKIESVGCFAMLARYVDLNMDEKLWSLLIGRLDSFCSEFNVRRPDVYQQHDVTPETTVVPPFNHHGSMDMSAFMNAFMMAMSSPSQSSSMPTMPMPSDRAQAISGVTHGSHGSGDFRNDFRVDLDKLKARFAQPKTAEQHHIATLVRASSPMPTDRRDREDPGSTNPADKKKGRQE